MYTKLPDYASWNIALPNCYIFVAVCPKCLKKGNLREDNFPSRLCLVFWRNQRPRGGIKSGSQLKGRVRSKTCWQWCIGKDGKYSNKCRSHADWIYILGRSNVTLKWCSTTLTLSVCNSELLNNWHQLNPCHHLMITISCEAAALKSMFVIKSIISDRQTSVI